MLQEQPRNVDAIRCCLDTSGARGQKAQCVAQVIRRCGYRWVGLYDVGPTEISVIAWDGPGAPTYPRFPITSGLNGAAVASCATVIVQDVTQDPRYLTTIGGTKAEMVVPVRNADGRVVGTIDVESDQIGAFTLEDQRFLETCAEVMLPLWSGTAEV